MRKRKCLIPSAWGFPIIRKAENGRKRDAGWHFLFPVDVPLFTPFTLEYEKYRFAEGDGDVYLPGMRKHRGIRF